MSFLEAIARKFALRAVRSELRQVTEKIQQIPSGDVHVVFDCCQQVPELLDRLMAAGYLKSVDCETFRRARVAEAASVSDQLRRQIAELAPVLSRVQGEFNDPIFSYGIYFWRVVLLSMSYRELRDDGLRLWHAVANRKRDYVHGKTKNFKETLANFDGRGELGSAALSPGEHFARERWLVDECPV